MRHFDEYRMWEYQQKEIAKNSRISFYSSGGGAATTGNTVNLKESDTITNTNYAPVINLNLTINIDAKTMEARNLSQVLGETIKNMLNSTSKEMILKIQDEIKGVKNV